MLQVDNVTKQFRGPGDETIDALAPVSLKVEEGSFVSIIGASGCGKSTLLRLIAGLEAPTTGTITLKRSHASQRIGFVFQDPVLLPWLSALRNVRFPLDTGGVNPAEADRTARRMIGLVGLEGFEDALPHQLSGGMRQRVSIARALSYDPPMLLMDEPFGALDLLTRDRLNDQLLQIWEATRKTIVFVTHSVEEAAYLSDTVIVMSARPGRVRATHQISLPRPRNDTTKLDPRFHKYMATFREELR